MFKIEETVNDIKVQVSVKVDCPVIWDRAKPKGRPPTPETINWDVSLRAMYHFIYTHLNTAYAMQSSKAIAFLGYVQGTDGKQLKDYILPQLSMLDPTISKPRNIEDKSSLGAEPYK